MKNLPERHVSMALLVASMVLTSCAAGRVEPNPSAVGTSPSREVAANQETPAAPLTSKTAGDARAEYLSFVADIRKETPNYLAAGSKPNDPKFGEYFHDSYGHFKSGMADKDKQYIINLYFAIFAWHPTAEVRVDEAIVKVSDDAAEIKGDDIAFFENGKELVRAKGQRGSGAYTLIYVNGLGRVSDMKLLVP
ncbi:hypothetical protein ACIPYU_19650 [Paenarthrobacter nicotinovorans]|uniref:hypothetical protein n=1 Tax=Paenarthrobacter nicotinovorans TaxID=29320 RepID=UPI0037FDD85E